MNRHDVFWRGEARRLERLHRAIASLRNKLGTQAEGRHHRCTGTRSSVTSDQLCSTPLLQRSAGLLNVKRISFWPQADAVQLPPTKRNPQDFQQTQLSGDSVKVSLQDCLACSGCVTSAETVLLEHQSTGELLSALQSGKTVIVSVSPQSRASLAVFYGLSPSETAGKLTHFLKSLGASFVLDTSASRDIALLETAQEFVARYKAKHPEYSAAQHQSESTGIPLGMSLNACNSLSACIEWISAVLNVGLLDMVSAWLSALDCSLMLSAPHSSADSAVSAIRVSY